MITYLTQAQHLSQRLERVQLQIGVTTSGGTIAAPKNAGVAAAISSNNGAIGPLEIAYILENTGQSSLYYGTIQNAAGNFILR